jgi:predicted DCC family thiol-disulfide oxidoreductase YuxK
VFCVTADPLRGGPGSAASTHPILLYDGVCGLCNRGVQFVLRHDPGAVFRFASLQSALAARILARHGADAQDRDTVYVVVDCGLPEERLVAQSDAVIFILKELAAAEQTAPAVPAQTQPGHTEATARLKLWRLARLLLQLVPRPLRDRGYRVVARYRYRIFGRYDTCPMPTGKTRTRFLDN